MWVRKRIDIGLSDIAYGFVQCCHRGNRGGIRRRLEARWSDASDTMACLSIRTGFDLLWKALDLPAGSEVIMSAATIKDMVRIVEHHGLTPVPVDLDMSRLSPKLDALRRAITSKTRAIVVAHLFGTHVPLEPIAQIAREHGLLLIEDCAQAFRGDRFKGSPQADVSMFSFGSIKTCTALQGALFRVRDRELLVRLNNLHDEYCIQRRSAYFRRLLKYTAIKAISSRPVMRVIERGYRLAGTNHDHMANRAARGFAGGDFFVNIRKQPATPLMAVLDRRLRTYDHGLLEKRTQRGRMMADLLSDTVPIPGALAAENTFWVLPIIVDDPERLLDRLWRAGFDATQGESMCIVDAPDDRQDLDPKDARETTAKLVYLPFYPQMSLRALRKMAKVVMDHCGGPAGGRRRRLARRFAVRRSPNDDRRRLREIVRSKFATRRDARLDPSRRKSRDTHVKS